MKNDLHGMTLPTCDIMVNGQKRKLYGKKKNKVYLHNGDNFQLQVFNPLQERIGVQLKMNGVKVDNDLLVVNPGQEVIIERFIGTNRKLAFSAYEIDTAGMSESRVKEAVKAIEKNGLLEIVFWNEKKNQPVIITDSSTNPYNLTFPTTVPNWKFNTSGSSITTTSGSIAGDLANLSVCGTDVVINGNLKLNGTLDINNGQLIVSSRSFGTSGSSGSSGTSGKSGISGTSGIDGPRGPSGTSGTPGHGGPWGINREKALKKWAPILDNLGVTDADKRGWMAEYAEMHQMNQNVNYSSTANLNGMGAVTSPTISSNANSRSYTDFVSELSDAIKYSEYIAESKPKKIETGRIEKGGVSDQYFTTIPFDIGEPFYKIKFKLLPFSLKPVKKKLYDSTTIKNVLENRTYIKNESSIREYCKCGYRISRGKGIWDFCPRCGRKIKK